MANSNSLSCLEKTNNKFKIVRQMVFWNEYDIANAFIGGLLIGAATTVHLLIKGRITGFSGIYYSLVTLDPNSFIWKLALMASIVAVSSGLFKAYG